MKIIADLHTHTIYSTHAYSTLHEMVTYTKKLGLKAIAITDHGPNMPDAGHLWHFYNSNQIPKVIDDVLVLFGAEVNVLDVDANLDIPDIVLNELDWVIASIHKEILPKLTYEEATQTWLNIAKNPIIDMIGHCEQIEHEFDIDTVIKAFAENNKVVEMNGNSANIRPTGKENMKKIALACKKYNCKIAINSDAHSMYKIADIDKVIDMIEEIEFPQELIINANWDNFKKEIILHNKNICNYLKV